jgi:hypothetical protein
LPTNWAANLIGLSREILGTGTENGITYIDVRLSGTTTGQTGSISFEQANIVASASQSWTASAYVKIVGGSTANISSSGVFVSYFNSSNQFLSVSVPVSPLTASFTRALGAVTTPANTAFVQPGFYFTCSAASGVAIDITLRIGLPQLEQGAFATSVIPTSGAATATRSADLASITGSNFSSWYRQDEGTILVQYRDLGVGPNRLPYFINDGTLNNRIGFFIQSATTIVHRVVTNNVSANPGNLATTLSTRNRHAIAATVGSTIAASNGTLSTESSPASMPIVTRLDIGTGPGGVLDWINAPLERITYFPTRLSNTTLQNITK